MIAPTILGLMILNIIPFFQTIYMSFSKTKAFGAYQFCGMENYLEMFRNAEFWKANWNSIYFCILTVPVGVFLALIVAVLLNAKIKGKTAFRAIFFLPMVVAPAAVAMVWKWIFNAEYGILNQVLGANIRWLTNPKIVLVTCAIVAIWSSIGYDAVLLLSGIQNISQSLYEAAELDGASKIRQFFSITLPMVSPTLFVVLIMRLMASLKVYDLIYMMVEQTNPALTSAQSLMYLFYRESLLPAIRLRIGHCGVDRAADRSGHPGAVHRSEEVGQLRGVNYECQSENQKECRNVLYLSGLDPRQHQHDLPLCMDGAHQLQDAGGVYGDPAADPALPLESGQLCQGIAEPALYQPLHQYGSADPVPCDLCGGVQLHGGLCLCQAGISLQKLLFGLVLIQMMLPSQIFIIPQYQMLAKMGATNSIFALVFPGLVSAFGTFFLRQAYLGIPNEIAEAAYLDGCNKWQTFVKVMLPLTGPSMAALAIFTAVFAYADLMWPLICNTDLNMMTLSAGLSTLNGQYTTNFPVLMAGSLLAMIPMVILY